MKVIFLNNAKVVVAYTLLAFISKTLFMWQSIAVPFWPAAGFAIAVISVYGLTTLPGVILGSLIAVSCSIQFQCGFSLPTLFVALASGVQAAIIGSWVANMSYMSWNVERPYELFISLLMIGPLGCWPAALVYFLTFYSGLPASWGTVSSSVLWWMGDSVGALLFVPATLLVLPKSPISWKKRRRLLVLPLLLIILVPSLGTIITQDLFFKVIKEAGNDLLIDQSMQKIQALIAAAQFISVFLAVAVALQLSEMEISRKEEIGRSRSATQAAAAVIHEISQPMFRLRLAHDHIRGLANKLSLTNSDRSTVKSLNESLINVDKELDSIAQVTRSIQDLTIAGVRDTAYANLKSAMDRAVAQMKISFDQRDQDLKVIAPSMLPLLRVGQIQLQTALRNLLSNASQAAGDQGVIYLNVQINNRFCEISVEDSGYGFENNLSTLGDEPVVSTFGGMGIGLMIVRRMVEKCAGRIAFSQSKKLGGASVVMSLPISTELPPDKAQL